MLYLMVVMLVAVMLLQFIFLAGCRERAAPVMCGGNVVGANDQLIRNGIPFGSDGDDAWTMFRPATSLPGTTSLGWTVKIRFQGWIALTQ